MSMKQLILVFAIALVASASLYDVEKAVEEKYKRIDEQEKRAVSLELSNTEKNVNAIKLKVKNLEKKISAMNERIANLTNRISVVNNNITALKTTMSVIEMKMKSADPVNRPAIQAELTQTLKQVRAERKLYYKLNAQRRKLQSKIKQFHIRITRANASMASLAKVIAKLQARVNQIRAAVNEEKKEELQHRKLAFLTQADIERLTKELREIQGKVDSLTGNDKKQAHDRMTDINHNLEDDEAIMKIQKKYIQKLDKEEKENIAIFNALEKISTKNNVAVKSALKRIAQLVQLKKTAKGSRRLDLIDQIKDLKNDLEMIKEKSGKATDNVIKRKIFLQIEGVKSEIRILKNEKAFVKGHLLSLSGKRCSIKKGINPEITKKLKEEQKKLEAKVNGLRMKLRSVNMRIAYLRRQKERLRKLMRKLIDSRVKEVQQKLEAQKKVVKQLYKLVETKNGNTQKNQAKLFAAKKRYFDLVSFLARVEAEQKNNDLKNIQEIQELLTTFRRIMREMTYLKRKSVVDEKTLVREMALNTHDWYRRRHLYKKIAAGRLGRKILDKRIAHISEKYLKKIKEEKDFARETLAKFKGLYEKRINEHKTISNALNALSERLKVEKNRKNIEGIKHDVLRLNNEMDLINKITKYARLNYMEVSNVIRVIGEIKKYNVEADKEKDMKRRENELTEKLTSVSRQLVDLHELIGHVKYENRTALLDRIEILEKKKKKEVERMNALKKELKEVEYRKVRRIRDIVYFLNNLNNEQMTFRLRQLKTEFTHKMNKYSEKLTTFKSDNNELKKCIKLAKEARHSLLMGHDNNEALRSIQRRCRSFPSHERRSCYAMAFKLAKIAQNVFDPKDFLIKNTCASLTRNFEY